MASLAPLVALLFAAIALAGCASSPEPDDGYPLPPLLDLTVTRHEAQTGTCGATPNGRHVVVEVQISNRGGQTATGAQYQVRGYSWEDAERPTCPLEEPAIAPGATITLTLRFPFTQAESCGGIKDIRLFLATDGMEQKVDESFTGFNDPCP